MQKGTPVLGNDDTGFTSHPAVMEKRLDALRHSVSPGTLKQELHGFLHRHWRYDQNVFQDGIAKGSYAEKRRSDLRAIKGAEDIAGQYGASLAAIDVLDNSPVYDKVRLNARISLKHPVDSVYVRSESSNAFERQCEEIYQARGGDTESDHLLFVNSHYVAKKILRQMSKEGNLPKQGGRATPSAYLNSSSFQALLPGLFVLKIPDLLTMASARNLSKLFGAGPSAYTIMAEKYGPKQPVESDPKVNNDTWLVTLKGTESQSISDRLRAIPDDHSSAVLAKTAASLLDKLINVLEMRGLNIKHRHDPVLENGLKALYAVADSLPTLSHDSIKFTNGYQIFMEEMQVCLSATKPYDIEDFRTVAAPLVSSHSLPETFPVPQVQLVSSGMGALAIGLELTKMLTGRSGIEDLVSPSMGKSPIYYELDDLRAHKPQGSRLSTFLQEAQYTLNIKDKNNNYAFTTTLHSSVPDKAGTHSGWGVNDVIEALQMRLDQAKPYFNRPVVLMLDATIEKRGEMDTLISHFADSLRKGRLRMVVCKSYQKYSNLGSGKVMGGGVALISADDRAARNAQKYLMGVEKDLNWMNSNESQLLIHMLGNRDHEFSLLDRAVENARFVAESCFHGQHGHVRFDGMDDTLPFGTLYKSDDYNHFVSLIIDRRDVKIPIMQAHHLNFNMIGLRGGFGFTNTTISHVSLLKKDAFRMSFGQESQAELTECFFMASRMLHSQGSHWGWPQAYKLVHKLIDDTLPRDSAPPNQRKSLAQRLLQIDRQERPHTDEKTLLTESVTRLRQQRESNGARGFTLNKIASVVNHMGNITLKIIGPDNWCDKPDRKIIDELLQGLIHSGMPGISAIGRANLMELQMLMCRADMESKSPQQQQAGLSTLIDAAVRIPGLPQLNRYLLQIPDTVFKDAKYAERDRAIQTFFIPLNSQARQMLIHQLLEERHVEKANACLRVFEKTEANPVL